jgi:hypothetical protein
MSNPLNNPLNNPNEQPQGSRSHIMKHEPLNSYFHEESMLRGETSDICDQNIHLQQRRNLEIQTLSKFWISVRVWGT